jgi:hypothetical protein
LTQQGTDDHLEAADIAAYVDGALPVSGRQTIDAHLARCAECRAEIFEVSRIIGGTRGAGRLSGANQRLWLSVAAIAAVVLIWIVPPMARQQAGRVLREETVTTTTAPRPLAPIGSVSAAMALVWSRVPHSTNYRVRIFDSVGTVVWDAQTEDTTATLPASLVAPGRSFYWKVEARTGFDRSTASDLTEFRIPERR